MNNSLFETNWWLDAVAPGSWDSVTVERDGKSVARLPFVIQKGRFQTAITMPPLTQTLGPWFQEAEGKYANRLAKTKDLTQELIAALPAHDNFYMRFHHSFTNWLPFYWDGFTQTTRYTYTFDDISSAEKLWDGFQKNIRTDIKKAESQLTVTEEINTEKFFALLQKTYNRQNRAAPDIQTHINRIARAAQDNNALLMLFAGDKDGNAHAAGIFVYDERCAYYLLGGADPEHRNSGAQSLLIWEALQRLANKTQSFDFEGSMNRDIERFFRAFGAVQTPYFEISRQSRLKTVHSALRTIITP